MCLCAGIEVHMKRFTQFGIVCIGLLVTGVTLCYSFSDASAREAVLGYVSPIDGLVGGEPGEDPHLRIPPEIKIEPIRPVEGSGGGGSFGYTTIGVSGVHVAEDSGAPCGTVYTVSWWRMFLLMLSRVQSR